MRIMSTNQIGSEDRRPRHDPTRGGHRWPRHRRIGRDHPRLAPRLEALEERHLLAVFPVSSNADSGPNTLRAAISGANNAPPGSTIDFTIVSQTIKLKSPLPDVTANNLTIDATGQA